MRTLTRSKLNLIWTWLPVALWLGIIALESTDALSSAHTGSLLYAIATYLVGPVDRRHFDVFHAVLRKSGHFVGYGILCLLVFRALRQTFVSALLLRWAALAAGFTFIVASLDEWHQSFLASRTGALRDVLLDTAGAIVMQAPVLLALKRRQLAGVCLGAPSSTPAAATARAADK